MENADDRIVIPSSMAKIVLAMIGAIIILCAGVWLVSIGHGSVLSRIIIIAGILFFGIAFIVAFYGIIRCMFFGKTPGLIIDDSGITNTTVIGRPYFVPWEDIADIKIFNISGTKIIAIVVNNPDDYLLKHKNPIIRQFAVMNYNMTGSPVTISASSLKCKHNVLENILAEQLMKRKNSVENLL
jgi:hypothetical protein